MADANAPILAFNRGKISKKALARIDIQRMAFSAEEQTNLPPRVLGSATLRPGTQYRHSTLNNKAAKYIPFVFDVDDVALPEITEDGIRFSVDDVIVTRPSVSTSITNGTFASDVSSWTDHDETGAASAWNSGGYLELVGTRFNAAIRRQEVTVTGADQGTEHGLRITVERGPVTIKIGSTAGDDDYVEEFEMGQGTYSFAFSPTANFHIELSSVSQAKALVDTVAIDSAGDFVLPCPYGTADLNNIRFDLSGDEFYIACDGYQPRKLERIVDRQSKSWGISLYQPKDGPFFGINVSSTTLTPSGLTGDVTLTASRALFKLGHVGSLFAITSVGQKVEAALNGADQFTDNDSMRVIGVGNTRIFDVDITGSWSGTITLQRSIDEPGSWVDVTTYTSNVNTTHDDDLDNQIAFYRIGFKTGDYTSGTATATLENSSGGIKGVARVTGFTSATVVDAAVLSNFGSTGASRDWQEGQWSDVKGYPSADVFWEGRLWWLGKGHWNGSISDAFDSFDEDFEGDAGPINRTIGSGPVDKVNWVLGLQRLVAGTAGAEISARSTSFDEILTPDNFNLKDASTQGSAAVPAVQIDSNGIFVQRGGTRVFEASFSFDSNSYRPTDLTDIVPEIGEPSIVRIAVQRQPDTRIHCVRSDGTVALLVREIDNEVLAWVDIETRSGDAIEDVVVMPGTIEDSVYYQVKRSVNGADVRYLEKWALESECVGGTLNKQADCFKEFTNSPASATVTGLTHLVGESVVVWADGLCLEDVNGDIQTFTVSGGGEITLTHEGASYEATTGIVGLAYRARFKSTKLAYASQLGTALTQRKRVASVGLMLRDVHPRGIKIGPDFTTMDDLPLVDDEGAAVDTSVVREEYDQDMFTFPGGWSSDARLCFEMNAPRPCTALGVVVGMEEEDKQ